MIRILRALALAALAAAATGCTAVQPWERDLHARADMQPSTHDAAIDDHMSLAVVAVAPRPDRFPRGQHDDQRHQANETNGTSHVRLPP